MWVLVAARGVEPRSRAYETHLVTGPYGGLAGTAGLEPAHVAVKAPCLTSLATSLYLVLLQGLEPRYDAYKAPALTFELQKYGA